MRQNNREEPDDPSETGDGRKTG